MGRRGHVLEGEVKKVLEVVISLGYHGHKNNPERTIRGIFIEGEPYDYDLFLPGHHHVFDTKECASDAWRMGEKELAQIDNLKHCKNAGCEAYFLIWFKSGVKQVDVDIAIDVLKQNKKTIKYEQGKVWVIPEILKKLAERVKA
jgi:hypothetical protein